MLNTETFSWFYNKNAQNKAAKVIFKNTIEQYFSNDDQITTAGALRNLGPLEVGDFWGRLSW